VAANEHGNCPHCNADLNGGSIWDHFYNEFLTKGYWLDAEGEYINERRILTPEEAEEAATRVAANYGATKETGKWGRATAEIRFDRVFAYHCPDCKGSWPR
jgi:hypothetical protein